jgi:hypothetical protein
MAAWEGTALQQRIHKGHIDHRGFVNDEQVAFERVLVVPGEPAVLRADLQQAVDGLSVQVGLLGDPLRRTPRRGRESEPNAFDGEDA